MVKHSDCHCSLQTTQLYRSNKLLQYVLFSVFSVDAERRISPMHTCHAHWHCSAHTYDLSKYIRILLWRYVYFLTSKYKCWLTVYWSKSILSHGQFSVFKTQISYSTTKKKKRKKQPGWAPRCLICLIVYNCMITLWGCYCVNIIMIHLLDCLIIRDSFSQVDVYTIRLCSCSSLPQFQQQQ